MSDHKSILVPTDFPGSTDQAVRTAAELARQCGADEKPLDTRLDRA